MLETAIDLEDAITPEIQAAHAQNWTDRHANKLPSGEEFFIKNCGNKELADKEILSYAVAEVLRAPVPAVYRINETQIVMSVVKGRYPDVSMSEVVKTRGGQLLALLHKVVANTDAHEGNWKMVGDEPVGYDFNHSFYRDDDQNSSRFAARLKMEWFSTAERQDYHLGLLALESLFKFHDRTNWYEQMMRRWKKLAPDCYGAAPPAGPAANAAGPGEAQGLYARGPRYTSLWHKVLHWNNNETTCGRPILPNWKRQNEDPPNMYGQRCTQCHW